ncbi:hypothetical protein ATANTOWER_020925 [Ataeniobius toweri]|uniref:Uncharacterized protein n=1 Tax=Ataeniobius toweri TaxID=208326 RepID=A0ABU7BRQ4_9TELE|nr:hypothetical protein [Ataeniobius toweri]
MRSRGLQTRIAARQPGLLFCESEISGRCEAGEGGAGSCVSPGVQLVRFQPPLISHSSRICSSDLCLLSLMSRLMRQLESTSLMLRRRHIQRVKHGSALACWVAFISSIQTSTPSQLSNPKLISLSSPPSLTPSAVGSGSDR